MQICIVVPFIITILYSHGLLGYDTM